MNATTCTSPTLAEKRYLYRRFLVTLALAPVTSRVRAVREAFRRTLAVRVG